MSEVTLRKAEMKDLAAITAIYNEAVLNSTATFDTLEKTNEEQVLWFQKHGEEFPIVVAVDGETVVAWASVSRWSDRCAYDSTGEVSIYVHKDARGRGIGRKLFEALVSA